MDNLYGSESGHEKYLQYSNTYYCKIRGINHLRALSVDRRIDMKRILTNEISGFEWCHGMWFSGDLLLTWKQIFGINKRTKLSWPANVQSASEEASWCMYLSCLQKFRNSGTIFYVLLTVHLDVILVNDQLDALSLNVFISTPVHVSSSKCSSSRGPTCINTPSGIAHSGSKTV